MSNVRSKAVKMFVSNSYRWPGKSSKAIFYYCRNSGDFVYIPDHRKTDSMQWGTPSTASLTAGAAQTGRGTSVVSNGFCSL